MHPPLAHTYAGVATPDSSGWHDISKHGGNNTSIDFLSQR